MIKERILKVFLHAGSGQPIFHKEVEIGNVTGENQRQPKPFQISRAAKQDGFVSKLRHHMQDVKHNLATHGVA